jgi:hypothetical protein
VSKWIARLLIAAMVAVSVVVCVGMYTTWKECQARGGTTVRGLFGLVCINTEAMRHAAGENR